MKKSCVRKQQQNWPFSSTRAMRRYLLIIRNSHLFNRLCEMPRTNKVNFNSVGKNVSFSLFFLQKNTLLLCYSPRSFTAAENEVTYLEVLNACDDV